MDGRIIGTLCSSAVVDVREIGSDWSPTSLLEMAAENSAYNAFIDVGVSRWQYYYIYCKHAIKDNYMWVIQCYWVCNL